jgi:ribose 5-phosphate isomerase A
MSDDKLKRAAAQEIVTYLTPLITSETVLGVGTGSSVNQFINLLPQLDAATLVSSSQATTELLGKLNLAVEDLNSVVGIDYYIDGADEVDSNLCMIKGGGGALTSEKILASISKNFLCIAHAAKYVTRLGTFPIAVEVLAQARSIVGREIVKLGGTPMYRSGFISDNGNIIIDIHGPDFAVNQQMEERINNITGVVENGIFCKYSADKLFLASNDGVKVYSSS